MPNYGRVSSSKGTYRTNEVAHVLTSKWYKPDGTRRGVIYCHAARAGADDSFASADNTGVDLHTPRTLCWELAQQGYPVAICDLGDPATYAYSNWGNDDQISAITAAWTHLKTSFGAKTDKVGILGASMGTTGMSWIRANLSSVHAAAFCLPVLDYNDVYVNDKGSGLRADIGLAYGVTYPTALPNRSTHNAVDFGSSDLAGLPLWFAASTTDPIAYTPSQVTGWDGRGCASKTVVDMGGIGHLTLLSNTQRSQFLDWWNTNGGRG